MKRFLAWLNRHQGMCAVRTDLQDTIYLHAGDSLEIRRVAVGFCLEACILRNRKFGVWPIAHALTLREIWDLREELELALKRGDRRFNTEARFLVTAKPIPETSEVAF